MVDIDDSILLTLPSFPDPEVADRAAPGAQEHRGSSQASVSGLPWSTWASFTRAWPWGGISRRKAGQRGCFFHTMLIGNATLRA
jgi:hypothetical protein